MAITEDSAPVNKTGPSAIVQVALVLGLTVAAIGIGWVSGIYLVTRTPVPETTTSAQTPQPSHAVEASMNNTQAREAAGILYLDPITTNLAGNEKIWIRLELALVFNGEIDLVLAQTIHQDILAYLRTAKMNQLTGASGFQHLRSDLTERISTRSAGKVENILIRTLLFE